MNTFESQQSKEDVYRRAEVQDIPNILSLLRKNLGKNLNDEEKRGGFLTYDPTEDELVKVINDTGIYLSLRGEELKGYLITMSKELAETIPFEIELLNAASDMLYDNREIKHYIHAVLAQICIAKEFRKGTTFHRLHLYARQALKEQGYEIGIGEIADTNKESLAVHRNNTDIGTYISSTKLKWHIIVIDLRID